MIKNTFSPQNDPMGAAIADYFNTSRAYKLRVMSDDFDEDEIPVTQLFRTFKEMSPIEQKALQIAQGRILDVGAGSGDIAVPFPMCDVPCSSLSAYDMEEVP